VGEFSTLLCQWLIRVKLPPYLGTSSVVATFCSLDGARKQLGWLQLLMNGIKAQFAALALCYCVLRARASIQVSLHCTCQVNHLIIG
jgi:hypothetical protein